MSSIVVTVDHILIDGLSFPDGTDITKSAGQELTLRNCVLLGELRINGDVVIESMIPRLEELRAMLSDTQAAAINAEIAASRAANG